MHENDKINKNPSLILESVGVFCGTACHGCAPSELSYRANTALTLNLIKSIQRLKATL